MVTTLKDAVRGSLQVKGGSEAPRLTVYFIVEPPEYQVMACYLTASLRECFGQSVALVGYCPAHKIDLVSRDVKKALAKMHCDLRPMQTEGRFDPPYPHGNKILATLEPRDTEFSCFMDSDILCLRPNEVANIIKEGCVSLTPAASMGWGKQDIWPAIYAAAGQEMPVERIRLMKTRGAAVMPYFSSGLFSFPEQFRTKDGKSFPQVWMDVAKALETNLDLPAKRPYLDQMSLPLAIQKAGLAWNRLPDEQHFILGGMARGEPLPEGREIFTVHYRQWNIVKEIGMSGYAKTLLKKHAGVKKVNSSNEDTAPAAVKDVVVEQAVAVQAVTVEAATKPSTAKLASTTRVETKPSTANPTAAKTSVAKTSTIKAATTKPSATKPPATKASAAEPSATVQTAVKFPAGESAAVVKTKAELKAEVMIRRARRDQRKAWAEGYMKGITTLLRPGDLVFDLGANKGEVTEVLAATGADVVAYEPDPVTFAKLTARFADRPNVRLVNAAVGIGSGTVQLMRGENFAGNEEQASVKSTIMGGGRGVDAGNSVEVPLIDFPALVRAEVAARGSIAFVKMDIEGAELEILEVMDREGLFEDIRGLVAETHERKFKDLRDRYRALKAAIAEHQPSGKVNLDWI